MTTRLGNAAVARSGGGRKNTRVTSVSAMAPRKNCAAGPAKFLVLLGVIRGLPLSGGEIRAFRAKKRQLLRISPGAVRRTVARSCGKELRQERPLGCALCRIAATY